MTLFSVLSNLEDPRRSQGLRTTLAQILTMTILSYLCGKTGYRGISRFCKSYSGTLTAYLGLKHGVPSHVTFREVLQNIDEKKLIDAFNAWSATLVDLKKHTFISGDGKSLGSTLIHSQSSLQEFEAVVSFFSQESGLVYSLQKYSNSKVSEINVVEFLINELQVQGMVICLDALHGKKNAEPHC